MVNQILSFIVKVLSFSIRNVHVWNQIIRARRSPARKNNKSSSSWVKLSMDNAPWACLSLWFGPFSQFHPFSTSSANFKWLVSMSAMLLSNEWHWKQIFTWGTQTTLSLTWWTVTRLSPVVGKLWSLSPGLPRYVYFTRHIVNLLYFRLIWSLCHFSLNDIFSLFFIFLLFWFCRLINHMNPARKARWKESEKMEQKQKIGEGHQVQPPNDEIGYPCLNPALQSPFSTPILRKSGSNLICPALPRTCKSDISRVLARRSILKANVFWTLLRLTSLRHNWNSIHCLFRGIFFTMTRQNINSMLFNVQFAGKQYQTHTRPIWHNRPFSDCPSYRSTGGQRRWQAKIKGWRRTRRRWCRSPGGRRLGRCRRRWTWRYWGWHLLVAADSHMASLIEVPLAVRSPGLTWKRRRKHWVEWQNILDFVLSSNVVNVI